MTSAESLQQYRHGMIRALEKPILLPRPVLMNKEQL